MKKMLVMLAAAGSLVASAAPWGPEELEVATHAALRQLRLEVGEGAYQNVVEFTTKMRRQKNAANVKVTYERAGTRYAKSFFCHTHGAEIDCH